MRTLCLGLLAVALAACSSAAKASATPQPSVTLAAPSSTPLPSATPQPTPHPAEACRLPSEAHLGLGFPRSIHRLPSVGTVTAVVLFADFVDQPATRSPQEVLAFLSPQAEQFFANQSYGRFALQLQPHFTWLRLSQPSQHYGESLTYYELHRAFLQEAVDLADNEVDFSQAELVILLNNPDAYHIVYGPTFTGFVESGLQADGVSIANGITSGRDLLHWGYLWLNHEAGHSLGLPDLYAYGDTGNQFVYTGGYSLMGNILGHAPEMTAMERWTLGWLDDEQIHCLPSGQNAELTLMAIEQPGGLKAAVVPLAGGRLLVVESRRAIGYDERVEEQGALVYIVDSTIASGYGPLRVLPQDDPLDNERWQAPLRQGESLEAEGLAIRVLEAGADYDRIEIMRLP